MTEMTKNQPRTFGKIRNVLWPIHNFELKKFIPMFLMFFFISINYSVLRIMKDTLVINAPGSGAEVLPYLKLWCTTPAAILMMIIYVKLSTILDRKKLFYTALSPFLIFFIVFPFILYPAISHLHPTTSADWLQSVLPKGLNGLIAIYRNWTFALFYVLSELWGSVVLSTLYWGFANEITKVDEAKRFYGMLLIGANVALLFVSPITQFANSLGYNVVANTHDWGATLKFINVFAAISCIAIAALYWYINNVTMQKPEFAVKETQVQKKKKKQKLGFIDSLKELSKSKYLAYLAFLVLAYGITINLVEVSWKHHLKELFAGNKQAFFAFQGNMMSLTGLTTIILLYFGTSNVLRRFSWGTAALITPVVLLLTSMIFFANVSFKDTLAGFLSSFNPLLIAAYVGGAQNILTKSTKYAFFDPTKEMAYIPLDSHTRRTGKAAIDGVGGRLGKSGGALINIILIGIFGSIEVITPFVAIVTIGITIGWIFSAINLNKLFNSLNKKNKENEEKAEKAEKATAKESSTAKD